MRRSHISRKELKTDEIRETLAHGAEAVFSHQKLIRQLGAPVLIVILAFSGWRFYSQRQTAKAATALGNAMTVFEARVRAPGEPAQPGELSYLDEKNKYSDAEKKFDEVAKQYPRTLPGQVARYYGAICLERLGRYEDAEKSLQGLVGSSDAGLASLARFELAQAYEQSGKGDQAIPLYQQLLAKPSVLVPKPEVLMALGDHYRKSNPQEAARLYKQVKDEFPNTGVADEADKRLAMLPGKT